MSKLVSINMSVTRLSIVFIVVIQLAVSGAQRDRGEREELMVSDRSNNEVREIEEKDRTFDSHQGELKKFRRIEKTKEEAQTRGINSGSSAANKGSKAELNGDFLDLFWELWRFKNNSITALIGSSDHEHTTLFHNQNQKNKINSEQMVDTRVAWAGQVTSGSGSVGEKPSRKPNLNSHAFTTTATSRLQTPSTQGTLDDVIISGGGSELADNKTTEEPSTPGVSIDKPFEMSLRPSTPPNDSKKANFLFSLSLFDWLSHVCEKIKMFLSFLMSPLSKPIGQQHKVAEIYRRNHVSATTQYPGDEDLGKRVMNGALEMEVSDEQVRQMEKREAKSNGDNGGDQDSIPIQSKEDQRQLLRMLQRGQEEKDEDDRVSGVEMTKLTKLRGDCVELTSAQVDECKSVESIVKINLNNSFPGTLRAVEENCGHLSFLLANCWPQQLFYLKKTLTSWNETILKTTDFPLPDHNSIKRVVTEGHKIGLNANAVRIEGPSCGVTTRIPSPYLNRIDWLWLNLCMDKKFRLDYVENLRCLSLWTQEKASQSCNREYTRMKSLAYPNHYESTRKRRQSRSVSSQNRIYQPQQKDNGSRDKMQSSTGTFGSYSTSPSNLGPYNLKGDASKATSQTGDHPSAQQPFKYVETEHDLEQRSLCCVFDTFLRCVNAQASRDCGLAGGQFVVNFLSRIGTDDMKYICKRTLDAMPHIAFISGRRTQENSSINHRNNHMDNDKSPFIDSYYCTGLKFSSPSQSLGNDMSNDDKSHTRGPLINRNMAESNGAHSNRCSKKASHLLSLQQSLFLLFTVLTLRHELDILYHCRLILF